MRWLLFEAEALAVAVSAEADVLAGAAEKAAVVDGVQV